MSGLGIGLLLFTLIVSLVALIKLLAWLEGVRERGWSSLWSVKHSQVVTSPTPAPERTDERTDEADGPSVSADDRACPKLRLDKTKQATIEVMVYNGWTTAEIRAVVKGENAAIGTEVDAARKRLGIEPPDRTLKVRDAQGERVISY